MDDAQVVQTSAQTYLRDEFLKACTPSYLKQLELESDAGNARRFVIDHAQDVKYVAAWRRWFIWDGFRYREDATNEILLRATRTMQSIIDEVKGMADADSQKKRLKHSIASQNAPRIHAMLDLAAAQPEIAARAEDFDADPDLLGVRNGVLNLRTGQLLADGERRLITKQVAAAYSEEATCPLFTRFLRTITADDADMLRFLRRAIGYSLTGRTSEQVLFMAIGTGANGKTTLIELLLDLLADYSARTPAEMMLLSNLQGAQIPNDIARLAGRRLVVATEIEQGRRLNESKVKEITGGDTLTARYMRGEWFDFRPLFKVMMAGNHLPRIHGADHGIWRRIRVINFGVTIPEAEQDRGLPEKLRDELPGILTWAVDGAQQWYSDGLQTPAAIVQAGEHYRSSEDIFGQFIAERCTVAAHSKEPLKDLTHAFNTWADANSERTTSSRNLGAWLEERGYAKRRGAGNAVEVQGLRLNGVT